MPLRKLIRFVLIYLLVANSIGVIKSLAEMIIERNGANSIRNENFNPSPQSSPDQTLATRTKHSDSLIIISATNTGLLKFANIYIKFSLDPIKNSIDPATVTTGAASGIMLRTWSQTNVTNIFSNGTDVFFTINAVIKNTIPGTFFPVKWFYSFNVDYNRTTNKIYFDN